MPDGVAAQHAHLSESIARVQIRLISGASWEELAILFNGLIEEFERHFKEEEQLMELGDYPAAVGHKREHDAFLMRVRALRAQSNAFQTELLSALANTLHSWLRKHERTSDKLAAEFLGMDLW